MTQAKVFLTLQLVLTSSCHVSQKMNAPNYAIAYSSSESRDGEIYLTDKEAQSKVKITDHPGNESYAACSPDGRRIASYAISIV